DPFVDRGARRAFGQPRLELMGDLRDGLEADDTRLSLEAVDFTARFLQIAGVQRGDHLGDPLAGDCAEARGEARARAAAHAPSSPMRSTSSANANLPSISTR